MLPILILLLSLPVNAEMVYGNRVRRPGDTMTGPLIIDLTDNTTSFQPLTIISEAQNTQHSISLIDTSNPAFRYDISLGSEAELTFKRYLSDELTSGFVSLTAPQNEQFFFISTDAVTNAFGAFRWGTGADISSLDSYSMITSNKVDALNSVMDFYTLSEADGGMNPRISIFADGSVTVFSTFTATNLYIGAGHLVVNTEGQINVNSPAPTVSACGAGATLATGSGYSAGKVTIGTGATSCTITWAVPWGSFNDVSCQCGSEINGYVVQPRCIGTLTDLTIVGTALTAGDVFNYHCVGF